MKQRWSVISISTILLAGAAVAIVPAVFKSHPASQQYFGTIETREIQVGSKIGGRVTQVAVEEGERVKTGDLLVRFECDDLTAQRHQAEAEVDQQRANLEKLERGNRPEEIQQAEDNASASRAALNEARNGPRAQDIAQAQADFEAAQADAIKAQADFDRMQKLVATDTISRMEFETQLERGQNQPANVSPNSAQGRSCTTRLCALPIFLSLASRPFCFRS
jgi:HlyD family secretion protein